MPSQVLMDWEVCTIDWDSVTCLHMELRAGIFNDSRKMKVPGLLVGWFFALFSESSSIMRPPFFYHLTTLSLASRNMSCGVSSYSRSGFNKEGLGLQFQSTLRHHVTLVMKFAQCRNKKTASLFGDTWRKYEKLEISRILQHMSQCE